MARKITQEDIYKINVRYKECGVYAQVARELGISAGTVKKYVDPDFCVVDPSQIKRFEKNEIGIFSPKEWSSAEEFFESLDLTNEEKNNMKDLWKEMEM